MKIAKIMVGNPDNKKGFFNNVIQRIVHLKTLESDVDCYIIRIEHGLMLSFLKGNFRKKPREEYTVIDGITFKNLWIDLSLINYVLTFRLHRKLIISPKQLKRFIPYFKDYDLLSSHDIEALYLSNLVKERFKIPFVATWHGSDINLRPFDSAILMHEIKNLIDSASHNFFVSQKLLDKSDDVSKLAKKSVLYTPPALDFFNFEPQKVTEIKKSLGINSKYVVGFVGSLIPIKNVMILPQIFEKLQNEFSDISFLVVGEGKLEKKLAAAFKDNNIKNLHMLGKKKPNEMPTLMNCLDVLIIPSLNEGLPRVTLEALSCGVNVVGSNRGGIPEAIGEENCFELDNEFISKATSKISFYLNNPQLKPSLPDKFSWDAALDQEKQVHNDVLQANDLAIKM